jgi:hypothetical protein
MVVVAALMKATINMVEKMVAKVDTLGSPRSSEMDGIFSRMS